MKIYTVLCITRDLDAPQLIVSNYTSLKQALQRFQTYQDEDKDEGYTISNQEIGDYEALNTVKQHFTALDPDTEEKIEEVFLIETEE